MKNAALSFLVVLSAVFVLARIVGPSEGRAGVDASSSSRAESAPRIDGRRARALAAEGALVLDVRTPEEFAAGHVEGAVNLPVQELERRMDEVPSDAEVVVYCRSGARSAAAAELLVARGRRVHDLGPMSAW